MKKKYWYFIAALVIIAAVVAAICLSGTSSKDAVSNSEERKGKPETVPVITLDGEYLKDYQNWNDKSTYYPATLSYTDGETTFTMEVEIKPQGTSSMAYPKKNITVKFAEDVEFVGKWGAQNKYVLKADYIDPTNSGNVVSANLVAEMNKAYGLHENTPNYGAIDGFPVFVKINGENAGIFSLTIPKDAWMLNMDSSNPNHLVLACEGWSSACSMRGYNIDFEADWSFEVGEATQENMDAFTRVVQFVATADDETFVRDFDQYLDLDACINYICFVNASFAVDNVTKNMLMATYDGKVWYPILYDLDTLWGIDWTGTALSDDYHADKNTLLTEGHNLFDRVTRLFGDQVLERYQELRQGTLSKEHIIKSFEDYIAQIPQEYRDINNALWYADGKHIRTVELMSQQMDKYLPLMDQNMINATTAPSSNAPAPATGTSVGNQTATLNPSTIHYVWETDGVQHSLEDVAALPVSTTMTYTLNGKSVSAQDLVGKSGRLEATLRVERKANVSDVFGVAAVVRMDDAQYKNFVVTGGSCTTSKEQGVVICTGSAWLNNTNNVYEMKLSMDVTEFDPAEYVVVINPVYVAGGEDASLNALLVAASELTRMVENGVSLHTSLTEWNTYLTNIQTSLETAGTITKSLILSEESEAGAVMQNMLAAAEGEADALLKAWGYAVNGNMTSEERLNMLAKVSADSKRTAEEKEQAAKLQEQIGNYVVVAAYMENSQQAAAQLDSALSSINLLMPDLIGAYGYAGDSLYAIVYNISTLYQNIANFYSSRGGDAAWVGSGDWSDVIIFSNHANIIP